MVKVKWKHYEQIRCRDRYPRKIKKAMFGLRLSSTQLKNKLQAAKITHTADTMYDRPDMEQGLDLFCPKCGCGAEYGTGNMTTYPEHWEYFYCYRCRNKTAFIDNSPYRHALEFPELNYSLERW